MIAELLKSELPSVSTEANVAEALSILQNEEILEVVVTDNGRYQYMIREIDIISSAKEKISEIIGEREGHFTYKEEHFLKSLQKMHTNDLSILPVLDKEMEYIGVLRKEDLLDYLCEGLALAEQESIIIIEQAIRDYSLASLSNVIEQEGGKILGVFIAPANMSTEKIWVSLTLKTVAFQKIVSSLERYGYEIIAHISAEESETMIKERYESLMTFLNI